MSDEQQNTRRKVVLPPVDAALRTPRATASGEEAPIEAVRAIAALLGRTAAPGRRAAAAPEICLLKIPNEAQNDSTSSTVQVKQVNAHIWFVNVFSCF